MAWLIDTQVICEWRKGSRANSHVRAWFAMANEAELYTSVLVVGEIRRGIELTARRDLAAAKAIAQWLRQLEVHFAHRILPVTLEISELWGRMSPTPLVPAVDSLLAATALHHGLTLVTRNISNVARCGAIAIDPFA
jgi:predicted nucleic acid-binding protein